MGQFAQVTFTYSMVTKAYDLAFGGADDREIAAALGLTGRELKAWRRTYYEFDNAIDAGRLAGSAGDTSYAGEDFGGGWGNNPGESDEDEGYVVSFSRSVAAVAVDDDGEYVTFEAGVLRQIDSKVTVEPARTNLVLDPNDFTTTNWTRTSVSVTAGQAGPSGLGFTSSLVQDTASSGCRLMNATALNPGVGRYLSFSRRFKRGNTDWLRISFARTSGLTNRHDVWLSLATGDSSQGSAGTGCGYVAHYVRALANGFYELEVVILNPTTTLYVPIATAVTGGSTTNAGTGSNYIICHQQGEEGTRSTSPILDASGTRTTDALVLRQPGAFYDWTFTYPDTSTQIVSVPGSGLLPVADMTQWTFIAPPVLGGLTDKLAAAKTAWAAAATTPSDIAILGDSVLAGAAATTYPNRWVNIMRAQMRTMFPSGATGGDGYLSSEAASISGFPWVQTAGSEAYNDDYGPKRRASSMTGAASFRLTKPGTSVDLLHSNQTSGGTYSYALDGGAATNVSTTGSKAGGIKTSVALGAGQVDIAWVSGNVKFEGAVHYNGDEAKGIRVHECGKSGRSAVQWNTSTDAALWPKSVVALTPKAQDIVMIALGFNDWTADTSPADLTTALEGVMSSISGAGFIGKFVLLGYYAPSGTHTYSWASYLEAMAALDAARADVKLIDISAAIGAVDSHPGDFNDFVHPFDAVHAQIGELVPTRLNE